MEKCTLLQKNGLFLQKNTVTEQEMHDIAGGFPTCTPSKDMNYISDPIQADNPKEIL